MIGPAIFTVLTDFRFEIGSALASSKTLQSAVSGISEAADSALFSFTKLATGATGILGVAGVLGAALQASDKFGQSQRAFANIISSNMDHLTGSVATFEERMAASEVIMNNINKLAQEFSLPTGDLLSMSKLLSATLVPKGLAGNNFSTAIDLSRYFLKAAPTLGIDPQLAQGQLLDAVQGRANFGDTLFQRLSNETAAFKPFNKQGGPQAFNALDAKKRVELLGQALKQFGSDADVLKGNAHSLSGEMRRLSEAFVGPFSILRPLGDILNSGLTKGILGPLNSYLQNQGAGIVKNLAGMIKPLADSPKDLLVTLFQLRRLKGDFNLTGKILGVLGIATALSHVLGLFGLRMTAFTLITRTAGTAFSYLLTGLSTLFGWITQGAMLLTGATTAFGAFWTILNGLVVVASRVLVPFGLILTMLQLISRSIAIAHTQDAEAVAMQMPAFTGAIAKFKTAFTSLMEPFAIAFDYVANLIAPLFRISYYFNFLTDVIDTAANGMILLRATLEGLAFGLLEIVRQFTSLEVFKSGGLNFGKISDAFNAGIDGIIEKNLSAVENGTATVQQTTNIGKVEIRNEFKQQLEPDRIAFTLKEQLLKAAQNPGQAAGRSLQGAYAR